MTHFTIVHEIDCTPEEFWRVFLDEPYNVALYERIGVRERRMLERTEDERTIHWALRIMPKRDLPAIIKKVVGGDLGYTEISTYYKGKDYLDVRIEPTLLKDRTRFAGVYSVKSIGPRRLRRTFEGDVHIDVPLVGRRIEAVILDDVRRSYEMAIQMIAEWLKKGM